MNIQAVLENRARIPIEELLPYDGQWMAVSSDGSKIIAGADDLQQLEVRLRESGVELGSIFLDHIVFDDLLLGGGDLL